MNLEFYTTNWETVQTEFLALLNHMFQRKQLSRKQKQGIIVNLPKCNLPKRTSDYCPITLLTTEYKIQARIMAQCLKHVLAEHLRDTQYCGVMGNTIIDAVACVRDVVTYADTSNTLMCVLSLDFEQAFDRLLHQYLFGIMSSLGISGNFINKIKALYEQAEAVVHTNGILSGTIPIHSGVRQECPLSMVLYAMFIHPLIRNLEEKLPAVKLGRFGRQRPVIAYADDVTIFVTQPVDLVTIQQQIQTYTRASGAKLNAVKSQALAIASWKTKPTMFGFQLEEKANILGISFGRTIIQSMNESWGRITHKVRAQARKDYSS
jgi:hypothetical protein